MTHYTSTADIAARVGYAIDDTGKTRPSVTYLAVYLETADGLINGSVRLESNMTDSTGVLKEIAISLVLKMINNMLHFTYPGEYDLIPVILDPEQVIEIRKAARAIYGKTWEIGD